MEEEEEEEEERERGRGGGGEGGGDKRIQESYLHTSICNRSTLLTFQGTKTGQKSVLWQTYHIQYAVCYCYECKLFSGHQLYENNS